MMCLRAVYVYQKIMSSHLEQEVKAITQKLSTLQDIAPSECCAKCKIPPEWRGKPLVFRLDHINGDPNDNSIEYLRMLCPNCHVQANDLRRSNRWECKHNDNKLTR